MSSFEELIFDALPSGTSVSEPIGNLVADRPPLMLTGNANGFAGLNQINRMSTSAGTGSFSMNPAGVGSIGPIAGNATAPTIQTALEGHASINPGDVVVTGGPLGSASTPVFIEWTGQFATEHVTVVQNNSGGAVGLTNTWHQAYVPASPLSVEALDAPPPKARAEWISVADSEGADLLRDPQHENREITLRVRVAQQASMDDALDEIGRMRDRLRESSRADDGIPMTWTPTASTRTVTFDVLHGEIDAMPITWSSDDVGWFMRSPVINVKLSCKPYWRGTETFTSTASSSTPITTLEIANVSGDIPALGRLIVTDTATQNRRHVEWGLESRNYNSATSLIIDSDGMVVTGTAGSQTTATGAYDPNASGNTAISASVGPLPVTVCKTGNMSHIGTFRVKGRVWYSTGTYTEIYVGLGWQTTGGEYASNPLVAVRAGGWVDVDLGTITISTASVGSQQWQGIITAQTAPTGEFGQNLYVDYLLLIPVDEGYGKARGVLTETAGTVVARDNYTGAVSTTVLNARVAPLGGTWATSGSANDDWKTLTSTDGITGVVTEMVWRYHPGGTAETQPRFAILGSTNYTDVLVRTSFMAQFAVGEHHAVIARWTDSSNYLMVEWYNAQLAIKQIVAGVSTTLATRLSYLPGMTWQVLQVTAYASGRVIGQLLTADGAPYGARVEATSTVVATAGTLATGKPGFSYRDESTVGWNAYYDNFYVSVPSAEPVAVYSGQSIEFRHNDTLREDSTGAYYGRPSSYRGSRFNVPPGTSRVAVKMRRNDTDADLEGVVTDATQIQVGTTPRGLVVPRV